MSEQGFAEGAPPAKKRKGPLFYFFLVCFLGLLMGGGFLAGRIILEKGALEVPLPDKAAELLAGFLPQDGKISLGPVRVLSPRGGAGLEEAPVAGLAPSEPLAGGSAVGAYVLEDEERPRAGGLLVPPAQSALGLMSGKPPGAEREKVYFGDDAVVGSEFIHDLAQYLANNYWPQGSHPSAQKNAHCTASVKDMNRRYGLELTGFSSRRTRSGRRDYYSERRLVLNYAFTPSMLTALSHLYADRLADGLVAAARRQERAVNGKKVVMGGKEIAAMLRYYADYSRAAGLSLLAYAESGTAAALVRKALSLEDESARLSADIQEARAVLEIAQAGGRRDDAAAARARLDRSEPAWRASMQELSRTKAEVVKIMARGRPSPIDNDNLFYMAAWAARRGQGAQEALRSAAGATEYFSRVLNEAAASLAPVSR